MTASNIKIDTRSRICYGYIFVDSDIETIYLCNRKGRGIKLEKVIGIVSHETIHLVLKKIAKEERLRGVKKDIMIGGIDNKFFGNKRINHGICRTGLDIEGLI